MKTWMHINVLTVVVMALLGTLLGTADFLRGRDVAAWEPTTSG